MKVRYVPGDDAGPLALVAAVWMRAWVDLHLVVGEGWYGERNVEMIRDAREFLLDPGALGFLEDLGLDVGAVVELVVGEADVEGRVRRDVVRGYEAGLSMEDIMRRAFNGAGNGRKYARMLEILEEVGG